MEFQKVVMVVVVVAKVMMVDCDLTIPGHSQEVLISLRQQLGHHYYPTESGGTGDLDHDLTSSTCLVHSAMALASRQPWALDMWDAAGKIGDGAGYGHTEVRGQPDQCRETRTLFPGTLDSHMAIELSHMDPQLPPTDPNIFKMASTLDNIAPNLLQTTPQLANMAPNLPYMDPNDPNMAPNMHSLSSHLTPIASHLPHLTLADLTSLNRSLPRLHSDTLQQKDSELRGRYCLVTLRASPGEDGWRSGGGGSWVVVGALSGHLQHTYATCIPHTCTDQLLQKSLQRQQKPDVVVSVICDQDDNNNNNVNNNNNNGHSTKSHAYRLFLLVTVLLVLLASSATLHQHTSPCTTTKDGCSCSPGVQLLHCFSLTDNWARLTSDSKAEMHLQTLNGLRVLSMVWVLVAHRYMLCLISTANPRDIMKHASNPWYWWVFNAYPSVDTFLFTSAFLTALMLHHRLHQYSFTAFCLTRYIRLAPALMYVLWGCVSLLPHLGTGPAWQRTYQALFSRPCSDPASLSATLLLIGNFLGGGEMCLGQLWSLAVEWQLYLVTPFLLLPLYRWPTWRYRWLPMVCCLVLAVLLPAVLTIVYHLPATPSQGDPSAVKLYYGLYYVMPWCRAGPYLVGLLAALCYHHLQSNDLFLTQRCVWAAMCVGTMCVVYVAVGPWWVSDHNPYITAMYTSLARPAWALALSLFIISTARGTPSVCSWLLSRPILTPLCRLSYSVYLVSLPLQALAAARPHLLHYDHLSAAYWVCGDVCVSGGVGLVVVLLVETPAARLITTITSGKLFRITKVKAERNSEAPNTTSCTIR